MHAPPLLLKGRRPHGVVGGNVPRMWEELDVVDWAGLRHNFGSAEDTPALLRRCEGPDIEAAEEAAAELDNLLFHQGGWVGSAATAALPFLVRLAAGTEVPSRRAMLELLAHLASTSVKAAAKHVDPGWLPAWNGVMPDVLALLADPDPLIRREVAYLVGVGGGITEQRLTALLSAFEAEQDQVTRLDLVLSIGEVAGTEPTGEVVELLDALLDSVEPQLGLAAVHALAVSDAELPARRLELVLAAVRDPSVELWRASEWVGTGVLGVHLWTGNLFTGATPDYALGLMAGHPDPEQRIGALAQAACVLSDWRSPTTALLPAVVERLADPDTEVRYRAVDLLACLGPAAARHVDALAGLLGDPAVRATRSGKDTVGDAALWAVARMNDPRCVPGLIERLTGPRGGFGLGGAHVGHGMPYWPHLPALGEVLVLAKDHAELLLPAVRDVLRPDSGAELLSRLGEVLAAWGPAAKAAVPELLSLLDDDRCWPSAATALGGIGPAANGARELLLARATASGPAAPLAAWAYWRVGGEPGPALAVLGPAATQGRFPHPDLRRLADLGPHGAGYAERLRVMAAATEDSWVSVEAAHALWRATGDAEAAVPALLTAVQRLADGTYYPVMLTAVRYLARMGPAARPAARVLRDLPSLDRRVHSAGNWRAFADDGAIRAAVAELLAAAG
ncbi:hypothetical protein P3T30_004923 [Kitasatospora sp. MAP12-9]